MPADLLPDRPKPRQPPRTADERPRLESRQHGGQRNRALWPARVVWNRLGAASGMAAGARARLGLRLTHWAHPRSGSRRGWLVDLALRDAAPYRHSAVRLPASNRPYSRAGAWRPDGRLDSALNAAPDRAESRPVYALSSRVALRRAFRIL